jgi:hypothetical protein
MNDKKLLTNDQQNVAPEGQQTQDGKQIKRKKDGIIERKNVRVLTDDGKELLKE